MRVAMVSEHADPVTTPGATDAGGQNVHVGALAVALARAGHEVTVHTRRADRTRPEREPLAPGAGVHRIPAGPPVPVDKDALLEHVPALTEGLRAAWLAEPPDVVHAHYWMSGLAARPVCRELGVPMVQTFHALGVVKRRHQGAADTSPPERVAAESDLAARADRVLATCRDEVAELIGLGAPRDRLSVVPCGVDPETFAPGSSPVVRRRSRVLVVGRLVPRKGVDTVVRAVAAMPGVELLVAGGPGRPGTDVFDTDPDVVRLRTLASRLGALHRVHLVGALAHREVPALIRSADVVACVPDYEPFGMAAVEAMSCGVPVVASRVGGLADTLGDGAAGRLVPPRDPEALAAAVGYLLDPTTAALAGAAGRTRVLRSYGWDRVAVATERAYRDVAGLAAESSSGVVR